jgi:outer membrane protein TolC
MDKYFKIFLISLTLLIIGLDKAPAAETLTWQDCVKEAQKNHPDLISAEEGIKQSEADKKITTSDFLPAVNGSVDASTAKTSTTTSGKTTSSTTDTYTYGVTGTQLLFDGFKTNDKAKAASENIKTARHNYRFVSSEVRLRLRTAFINLLKAQELLNITKEIYNIRRNNLELISLRYASGMEHKGALLTAEANIIQAEFEITQADRALKVAQRELLKEIGRTQFLPVRIEGSFKIGDLALEKPDFEMLAEKNPSLEKYNAQTKAALFDVKAAKADFYPQLSAQAAANRKSSNWPPENDQWSAGLSLSIPIFEGGLRFAQVAKAESVFDQAKADERSKKDSVIVALEETWASFQDFVETVEVKKKFLLAAEERAKIAEAQYSLGLIQFDNWTIIEDDLVGAKKTLLDAQANALLAEASWIQAKGETLEYAK